MKKKLIVLLMFLLSCLAIYSDEINNQSNSNSFSSKNFLENNCFSRKWRNSF